MERDPFRFAWRAAPRPNTIVVALALLVGLPLLWVALDVVALTLDSVVPGRLPEDAATVFLRYAIRLPDRIRDTPIVIVPGLSLRRPEFVRASVIALALVVLAAGAIWWGLHRLGWKAGRRTAIRLANHLLDSVSSAPLQSADEARLAANVAAETIVRERDGLDFLATMPLLAGGMLAATLGYVFKTGPVMGLWLVACLVAAGWLARRRAELATSRAAAEAFARSTMRRSIGELTRYLPAVAAHGTRGIERERLAGTLSEVRRPTERLVRRATRRAANAFAVLLAAPLGLLAIGAWRAEAVTLSPGSVAAAALAGAVASFWLVTLLGWQAAIERLRPAFDEIGRSVARFQARRGGTSTAALPGSGMLAAFELSTDSVPTGRLVYADLEIELPAFVALAGSETSGARTFAAVLGSQIVPSAGILTFGGVDLDAADPQERAQRLAYAGGPTYLFPGSLRANLIYGVPNPDDAALDARLGEAVAAAGLDRLLERRGMSGSADLRQDQGLAAALLEARAAIRRRLDEAGLGGLVEPFDPDRYLDQATIGENILLGIAIGDTFREDRLPSQPFVKGLLEREDLAKPLASVGAAIAKSNLEMFGEITDGSRLLARFALVAPDEREEVEAILDRRESGRRGTASARDADRLIGIALRYCEPRHRLGLIGDELKSRVLKVRALFAETVPKSLGPAVELFHQDSVCAAASIRDNLLFGRVAQNRWEAEEKVAAVIRAVVRENELGPVLHRVALGSRVDPNDPEMSAAEIAAVDLVRCLVRQPDNLVVEHALDPLSRDEAAALLGRLKSAMTGRGLIVALPPDTERALTGFFDSVVRFDTGRPVEPDAEAPFVPEPAQVAE